MVQYAKRYIWPDSAKARQQQNLFDFYQEQLEGRTEQLSEILGQGQWLTMRPGAEESTTMIPGELRDQMRVLVNLLKKFSDLLCEYI